MVSNNERRRQAAAVAEGRDPDCYWRVGQLWRPYPFGRNDCIICGKRINKRHQASIEHRVPVAHGGRDIFSNIGLAHKWCNQALGAAMPYRSPVPRLPQRPVTRTITPLCAVERCRECDGAYVTEVGATVRCACECHRRTAWPRW